MNSDIICVFGGTFNPVHTGHIEIARHVHSQFNLDKILIMPSGNPSSYKDTSLIADAKDRCNMISLSIKDYPYMELSELPSPIAFNNGQMLKNILDFSWEEYEEKRKTFMKKMDYYDDGHAAEAVVDYILKLK